MGDERRRGTRILVMGRQGAGKGTQCARLAAKLGVPHVSTGDVFRAAAAAGTDLGRRVKAYIDAGELVPDDVVVDVVVERLRQPDARHGFILDGFPRTAAQAGALFTTFGTDAIDVAVEIDVPAREVLRRLALRRVCDGCGAVHVAVSPGVDGWPCGECGGRVRRRDDDHPDAIRRRLDLHEEQAGPLLIWLHSRGVLHTVDGLGDEDEVHARLLAAVDAGTAAAEAPAAAGEAPAAAGEGSAAGGTAPPSRGLSRR